MYSIDYFYFGVSYFGVGWLFLIVQEVRQGKCIDEEDEFCKYDNFFGGDVYKLVLLMVVNIQLYL